PRRLPAKSIMRSDDKHVGCPACKLSLHVVHSSLSSIYRGGIVRTLSSGRTDAFPPSRNTYKRTAPAPSRIQFPYKRSEIAEGHTVRLHRDTTISSVSRQPRALQASPARDVRQTDYAALRKTPFSSSCYRSH